MRSISCWTSGGGCSCQAIACFDRVSGSRGSKSRIRQNNSIDTSKPVAQFVIRDAAPADAEQIVEILKRSFAEFAGLFDPPSGALSETEQSVLEKLNQGHCFITVVEESPAGCVFARAEGEDLYLFRLAVLPNSRGGGMGVALVKHVENYAREHGFKRVRLGTRLAVPRNIKYYERLGYAHVEDGVHPATGRPFYAVMVKTLA